MFLRFLRFNVVGVMGVAVQVGALALLVSGLGLHYLPATAVAIEISVLHNFAWHERWTWRERVGGRGTGGAAGGDFFQPRFGRFARLVAFHAGNGMVSTAGSLVLMPVFVDLAGLHYLVANLATIAATGLFNFFLGDRVIFGENGPRGRALGVG